MVVFCFVNPIRLPGPGRDFGFDMEYGDWVEPYGQGKVADFLVRSDWGADTVDGGEFMEKLKREKRYNGNVHLPKAIGQGLVSNTLTISFPNCLDGAYPIDLDDSFLKSPYHADPNGDYIKTFSWKYAIKFKWKGDAGASRRQRVPAAYEPACDERLAKGQGLILRTRTRVDAEGNLVSAHYGKIYGEIRLGDDFFPGVPPCVGSAWLFFNPVENDTNLECDSESFRNWLEAQKRGEPVGAGLYVL
jgi:hypothetical protein